MSSRVLLMIVYVRGRIRSELERQGLGICDVSPYIRCYITMRAEVVILDVFFFFKQKTAYEMRISDWSSDVCSSDLRPLDPARHAGSAGAGGSLAHGSGPYLRGRGVGDPRLPQGSALQCGAVHERRGDPPRLRREDAPLRCASSGADVDDGELFRRQPAEDRADRKSTRLNSSH